MCHVNDFETSRTLRARGETDLFVLFPVTLLAANVAIGYTVASGASLCCVFATGGTTVALLIIRLRHGVMVLVDVIGGKK